MSDLHKNFFDCATRNIEKRVKKKLKHNNTLKSNIATPHHRKVTLSHVPKYSFTWVYGRQFDAPTVNVKVTKVKIPKESTGIFCLKSLKRVVTILSTEAIIKVHKSNDVSSKIILFDDNKHCFFESGTLVLLIYEECGEKMVVLFCVWRP